MVQNLQVYVQNVIQKCTKISKKMKLFQIVMIRMIYIPFDFVICEEGNEEEEEEDDDEEK